MKHLHSPRSCAEGFTLAEVAITAGIVAGTLAILVGMMTLLSQDVARLKPYEAGKRLAFDHTASPASPTSGTNAASSDPGTSPGSEKSASPPKETLPDEHLDPASGRDETAPPGNSGDGSSTGGTTTSSTTTGG